MWSAVRKHWYTWDFTVHDATRQPVAEVRLLRWKHAAAMRSAGHECVVSSRGLFGSFGPFVLQDGETLVARVEQTRSLRPGFQLEYDGRRYTLAQRPWRRQWWQDFVLYEEGQEIGSIAREGLFWIPRRLQIRLPDDLPPRLRLLVTAVALIVWRWQLEHSWG